MARARLRPGFLRALLVCLGLYAGVVLASPGLHHDFDCHVKSPRHCQACTANPLAPRAEPSGGVGVAVLAESGRPPGPRFVSAEFESHPRLADRAPPR